jgi:hypothetical protein
MSANERQLYRSSNGDRWYLVRDPASGHPMVKHAPNEASGGRMSLIDLGTFLSGGAHAPERQNLLSLIGTLLDAHDFTSERATSNEGPERKHREEVGSSEVDDLAARHGISNDQASRLIRQVGPDRDKLDAEAAQLSKR